MLARINWRIACSGDWLRSGAANGARFTCNVHYFPLLFILSHCIHHRRFSTFCWLFLANCNVSSYRVMHIRSVKYPEKIGRNAKKWEKLFKNMEKYEDISRNVWKMKRNLIKKNLKIPKTSLNWENRIEVQPKTPQQWLRRKAAR